MLFHRRTRILKHWHGRPNDKTHAVARSQRLRGEMQVFVTGGTGFIGSELVRQLVAAGHDVTGLARTPENARRLEGMGASAIVGDVRTPPGASGRREGRGRGRAPRAS